MPRRSGYSFKGKRCYGIHDWAPKKRTNVIGALVEKKLLTTSFFEASINSDTFYAWLVQDLLPKVPEKSVLVFDNAAFHQRKDIHSEIKKSGIAIEYLPTYSPDLNPIEKKWAQAKALIRTLGCSIAKLFSSNLL